jgi:hypothetical protein
MPLEIKIKTIGELRKLIKDLPDKMTVSKWSFDGENRADLKLYAIKEENNLAFAGGGKIK